MRIEDGKVVGIDYKLHLGDGDIVDESTPEEPLQYIQGQGQIVPGLEKALAGLTVGDEKKVVVPPEEGYGEHDTRGVQDVPRDAFPAEAAPQVGQTYYAHGEGGETIAFLVKEIGLATVKVDFNHPLAGKTLHFDVKVREVRAATEEELEHGHAHGPEGHEHD
ncbi:MAG TPA: peptidylprolyl isomerase [Anaeromyxobacteraceae bacterium]|nr:peptidylprolyl isomerase [Anaeromyxobacteraceae bacterium]